MEQKSDQPMVVVDSRSFVFYDGVKLGKLSSSGQAIQILDKDRRRSEIRGSRYVEVPLAEIAKLSENK